MMAQVVNSSGQGLTGNKVLHTTRSYMQQGLTCNKGHGQHQRHSNGCSMPTAVVPSTAGGSTAWSHC